MSAHDSTMPGNATATKPWLWQEAAGLLLLWLVIWLLVLPGMSSPLLLDDLDQLQHVQKFQSWKEVLKQDCYGLFRPIKNILYYAFHTNGQPPLGAWHAVNLAVYFAATAGVYFVLRSLLSTRTWAFVGACLWATSATQATTALWMSCVQISAAMFFTCLALRLHDRSWSGQLARWLPATLVMIFLAMASYETAVCVAPLCVLLDHYRGRRVFAKPALIRYVAIAAVTLAYLGIRFTQGAIYQATNPAFDPQLTSGQLFLSAPWFMWKHFSMWLFPFGRIEFLSAYLWGKSAPLWHLAVAWGFLIALIAAVFLTRKRLPMVSFGIAWFLIASLPSSNLIPVRSGPIEDYYLVFPSAGLVIALVSATAALVRFTLARRESTTRILAWSALAFLALWRAASGAYFFKQSDLWNRPLDLYLSVVETRPLQIKAMNLAARDLYTAGDRANSEKLAGEAQATAPWDPSAQLILGSIACDEGRHDEAITRLNDCITVVKDRNLQDYANLRKGDAFSAKGDLVEARKAWLEILVRPASLQHFDATIRLAKLYHREGNREKAVQTLNKSKALHPARSAEIDAAIHAITAAHAPSQGNSPVAQ